MRKNLTLSLILASAMALTTAAVSAQVDDGPQGGGHGGHEHGHEHGQFMAMSKLNLTEAQRASIKQIMQTHFTQNKAQHQALRQQRDAFESMLPDQVGYQAAAASLAQAEGSATQQRVQQQAALRTQVYAILTAQQKAQYATLKTQREARKAQWEKFKSENSTTNANPAPPPQ